MLTAPPVAGRRSPSPGRAKADQNRRSRDSRDQSRPGNGHSIGTISRGPLLAAQRVSNPHPAAARTPRRRSEEHTSELQSLRHLVCRLLLEKKKKHKKHNTIPIKNCIPDTHRYSKIHCQSYPCKSFNTIKFTPTSTQ